MRAPRRSNCPISLSLEILGDRWSLLVLRDMLLFGKRRYGELLESKEAISTNILADRLSRLEETGIITRSVDEKGQVLYDATQKGRDLRPVLSALVTWGMKYHPHARKGTRPASS